MAWCNHRKAAFVNCGNKTCLCSKCVKSRSKYIVIRKMWTSVIFNKHKITYPIGLIFSALYFHDGYWYYFVCFFSLNYKRMYDESATLLKVTLHHGFFSRFFNSQMVPNGAKRPIYTLVGFQWVEKEKKWET